MKKTTLTICTSLAALTLAAGSALAQSEGMAPGEGGNAGPSMEMAPPAGSDAPGSGMEPGLEGRGAGDEGRGGLSDRNLRTGEPFDGGDRTESRRDSRDPAGSGMGEREDPAATGRSDGEAGRDRSDRGERHERRARDGGEADADDRSRASDGASEGGAGREDRLDRAERAERGEKDARERGDGRDTDASEGAAEGVEGKGKPSGSLTKLDGEKRSEVQSVFRTHRSEAIVRDIDIDLNIGVSVPRTVELHAVPEEVVVLVPEYRAYRYFIYEDHVVVVDPDTLEIVDVLVLA